ncbi:MAG: hypothetical protein EGR02_05785 [Clostridiales bacterium]|nr:hypothetical protein [Clostridiales bacterium]
MYIKKILQWVMLLSGGISACNLLAFYFLPLMFPMANVSIIKLTFIAIAEKRYGYILISCMLTILIIIGAASIKRNHILLPIFSLAVYLGDLMYVGCLFVKDLISGFINTVVIWSGIVDIIAIVLFALYFTGRIKSIKQNIHYSDFQNSSHP